MSIEPVAETASAALQPPHLRCWASGGTLSSVSEAAAATERSADHEFRSDMRYGDTNDLLNSMQALPIDSVRLADLLHMDGASMWQFLPSFLWPDVFRAVELAKVVSEAVATLSPQSLVTLPCSDRYEHVWQHVGAAVAAKSGIEHIGAVPAWRLNRARPLALQPRGLVQAFSSARKQRRAATSRRWDAPKANRRLLFATLVRHWVEDPARPGHRYDEQLSPLLNSLREAGWDSVVAVDCPYNGAPDLGSIRERQEQTPEWVTWRSFNAHGRSSPAERRHAASTSRWWQRAVADGLWGAGALLEFRGVELGRALTPIVAEHVRKTLRDCADLRAQARRMLEQEAPDAVMASYETGPYARALLIEASRRGIATVGLQHGMILDNHYDYMHAGVGPDPGRDPFTIPTRTCVWGPFWKRVLTEAGHYPGPTVRITGNWRHTQERGETEPEQAGRDALGVPPGRSLVLVCTAAQGTEDLVRGLGRVREAVGEAELRIRPHPSESLDVIATAYAAGGGDPAHVSRAGELAAVLAASDLVISQLSTVISEAVLADRPVIVADFDRQEGWDAYKASDATLIVTDEDELAAAASAIASDSDIVERLRKGRAELVDDFFNGRDGHAAERVVAAIES